MECGTCCQTSHPSTTSNTEKTVACTPRLRRKPDRGPIRVTRRPRHPDLGDTNLRKRRFGRNPALSSTREGRSDDLNLQFKRYSCLDHHLGSGSLDQPKDLCGRSPAKVHDKVAVFLGDLRSSSSQSLESHILHQTPREVSRRVLENAPSRPDLHRLRQIPPHQQCRDRPPNLCRHCVPEREAGLNDH